MASINISEDDFGAIFNAAHRALDAGAFDEARALDKIGRKINAALSHNNPSARIARMAGARGKQASWEEQPSVFDGRPLPEGFAISPAHREARAQ